MAWFGKIKSRRPGLRAMARLATFELVERAPTPAADAQEVATPTAPAPRRTALAIALLALTLVSTTVAGAVFADGYFALGSNDITGLLTNGRALGLGFIAYALPLVIILGVHELGHAWVLRRKGLPASWPFFLPLPPPLGFTGTMGAVIAMKDRMPDRRTLVRMAAAGPLAGLACALVVLLVGFALTGPPPAADASTLPVTVQQSGGVEVQTPLLFDGLARLMHVSDVGGLHPVAIAGWLGLFLTSLQLFPAGQLDGGHIARALIGPRAVWLGWVTVALLAVLGFLYFPGYAVLALVLLVTGVRHPGPLADGALSWAEYAVGALCIAVFAVTFVVTPIRA